MKYITLLRKIENRKISIVFLVFVVAMFSTIAHAQDYRTIDAYMDDFGKNEMFVKKALIDYSVTIIESQMNTRSKVTSDKIVNKLANINQIMKTTNKGFENNTLLRDSFIRMNEKTIESLKNGSLILNDYDYQSTLSFAEINANMAQKEKNMQSYYDEMKNFDKNKRAFGSQYNVGFKSTGTKNVLEYNAYQNLLFYKMNVIDQKLSALIDAKDKAGFAKCFAVIDALHDEIIAKTNQYKGVFKDNSMNDANVKYANFIQSQKEILSPLFNDFADESAKLAVLKKSSQQTPAAVAAYNEQVRAYNAKKNAFYAVFDRIKATKKNMYDNWYVVNSKFLQHNGEFENIHEKYTLPNSNVATR